MKSIVGWPLVITGVFAGTPAWAAVLWQHVESGMTVAQVRALYPTGGDVEYKSDETLIHHFAATEHCAATVHIDHPAGLVTRVRVRGTGSLGGHCSEAILDGLSSRYGQPLIREHSQASILAREGNVYVWHRDDGVTLRFKRFTNGAFGGGGLGAASWELQYSTVTEDINL